VKDRCQVPQVPEEVAAYCGVRCEKAGKSAGKDVELKCYFLVPVIDGVVYSREKSLPIVSCDPTGWWRYIKPGEIGMDSKWIDTMYCFYGYKQTDVFSDCVLDRFECGSYGDCPVHRQHQVDCDGNEAGRKLAVFHPGYNNSFIEVNNLGCDQKNGWWTVEGKSLPKSASVDCVWPFELEILKQHAAEIEDWDPEPVEPRAQSKIGPTVRNAMMIWAGVGALLVIVGIVVVCTRLGGPKARMMTRQLRSFYPSLLNEDERNDYAKAEKEYKNVDSEAARLILHEIYKNPAYKTLTDANFSSELHTYWICLSWPRRNLVLERALLHRAFYGLKILYDKFKLPENESTLDTIRPGLKEKIVKACKQYNTMVSQWTLLDLIYSLAFASLTKAELEGFRRNEIKRKILKPLQ
ncbi:hypothetical protein PENTCL1PPCAC_11388, partial [Pristionchus entomophagus]